MGEDEVGGDSKGAESGGYSGICRQSIRRRHPLAFSNAGRIGRVAERERREGWNGGASEIAQVI